MKVREILGLAAEFAGRRDVADFLGGRSAENAAEGEREADTLLRCYNIAENELALDYLPIERVQRFESEGLVPYTAFEASPVEILSVRDGWGRRLPFTAAEQGVRVRAGSVEITYAVRPQVKKMDDDAEECWRGNARLLALCTACEYALMSGMFEAAAFLDKRCRDALACACRERGGRFRLRRWV